MAVAAVVSAGEMEASEELAAVAMVAVAVTAPASVEARRLKHSW